MKNRFRLHGGSALVLLFLSVPFAALSQPVAWTTSSLIRTGKTDAAGSGTQATLSAARGEYESFQIAVKAPPGGLSNVNVTVSDLSGPGVIIAKSNFSLFREQYVYVNKSSPDWEGPNRPLGVGWYPDGLIPFTNPATGQPLVGYPIQAVPFSLDGGSNQPIWVDLFIPRDAVPGQYSGTYTVTSDQGSMTGNIAVTVWNFTLPLQSSLKTAFLLYNSSSLASDKELLRNKVSPLHTDPATQSDLIASYGLSLVGLSYFSGAAYGNCTMSAPPSVADLSALSAQQDPSLTRLIYSADETNFCPSLVPSIQEWARNLHQAGIQNLVTAVPNSALFDDGSGSGRSAVDIWAMVPVGYDQSPSLNAAALNKGDSLWSYNALVQDNYSPKWLIDFAPMNFRIQPGFISQSLSLTGMTYWKVDSWTDDPWNQVNNTGFYAPGNYPGEGMLVYPGYQVGIDGVAPSMRLKWLRDGIEDYEYVQMLKLAGQGTAALNLAASVGPDWKSWTRDTNQLLNVRQQLGEKLNQLNGGSASVAPAAPAAPAAPVAPAETVAPSQIPAGGGGSHEVSVTAVVNSAAGAQAAPGVLTPGSYVSIYGTNLGGSGSPGATSLPLPTTLNGTQVFLGSTPIPLVYAGPNQINGVIPQGLSPGSSYSLVIVSGGYSSNPVPVSVALIQPAIYSTDSTGSGQGVAYIAGTTSLAAASGANARPAKAGEYLTLYCNALGPVSGSAPADGHPAPAETSLPTTGEVTVSFGGTHQTAQFAGLAPGLVGVYQVNVLVPAGLSGDAVPVTMTQIDPQTGAVVQSNTVTAALR